MKLEELLAKTRISKLSEQHKVDNFDCGQKELDEFLAKDAIHFQKLLGAVTYVLTFENQIIAYYSLQNDNFNLSPNYVRAFKSALRKQTKTNRSVFYQFLNMTSFPALKIIRLAVHKDFQRIGIGTYILDTITFPLLNQPSVGCMFITLDAIKNQDTIDFYTKNKFQILDYSVKKHSVLMYRNLVELI